MCPCGGNIFSLSVQVCVRLWRSTRLPLISSAEMEIQCSLSAPTVKQIIHWCSGTSRNQGTQRSHWLDIFTLRVPHMRVHANNILQWRMISVEVEPRMVLCLLETCLCQKTATSYQHSQMTSLPVPAQTPRSEAKSSVSPPGSALTVTMIRLPQTSSFVLDHR